MAAADELPLLAAAGADPAACPRVHAFRAAGELTTAALQCQAAAVLLGGEQLADAEAAQALALQAMVGEPRARPLAARAFDRLRRLRGQPQKFGTEWVAGRAGPELWPVDPHTTDSERAKWGLPPLAELRRRGPAGAAP